METNTCLHRPSLRQHLAVDGMTSSAVVHPVFPLAACLVCQADVVLTWGMKDERERDQESCRRRQDAHTHTLELSPPHYFQPLDHSWFLPSFHLTYLSLTHLVLHCFKLFWSFIGFCLHICFTHSWLFCQFSISHWKMAKKKMIIVPFIFTHDGVWLGQWETTPWVQLHLTGWWYCSTHHRCFLSSLLTIMASYMDHWEQKDVFSMDINNRQLRRVWLDFLKVDADVVSLHIGVHASCVIMMSVC